MEHAKINMRMMGWTLVFLFSGFMTYMSYVYGDNSILMAVFKIVWPALFLLSIKKYNDAEIETGPKNREYTLGTVESYNEVLGQYLPTDKKITVKCLEPVSKILDFKPKPTKFIDHKILVDGKEYSISDLTKFIILESESIKEFYAELGAKKRAVGNNGQTITDAMSRQRDLKETRRIQIGLHDGSFYSLCKVNEVIAKDIENMIKSKP